MHRLVFLFIVAAGLLAAPARSQAPRPFIQAGAAIIPGTGLQVGYAQPTLNVFTGEGHLYADYRPGVLTDERRLLLSLGVGGSVRLARVLALTTDSAPEAFDIDVGLRLGPAFSIPFSESSLAGRAQAFRLFMDPFARGVVRLDSGRSLFVEVGTQAPALRGGLVFGR